LSEDELEERLKSKLNRVEDSPAGSDHNDAAVLILIRLIDGEPYALFEKRVESERDRWSAQVAFPGGRFEKDDVYLVRTACREFKEETGLDACSKWKLLGFLPFVRPGNVPEVRVFPFVCLAKGGSDEDFIFGKSEEVNELFWLPLYRLSHEYVEIVINDRKVATRALVYGERVVWGMTQRIVEMLLDSLG